jgi:hypothetical protein
MIEPPAPGSSSHLQGFGQEDAPVSPGYDTVVMMTQSTALNAFAFGSAYPSAADKNWWISPLAYDGREDPFVGSGLNTHNVSKPEKWSGGDAIAEAHYARASRGMVQSMLKEVSGDIKALKPSRRFKKSKPMERLFRDLKSLASPTIHVSAKRQQAQEFRNTVQSELKLAKKETDTTTVKQLERLEETTSTWIERLQDLEEAIPVHREFMEDVALELGNAKLHEVGLAKRGPDKSGEVRSALLHTAADHWKDAKPGARALWNHTQQMLNVDTHKVNTTLQKRSQGLAGHYVDKLLTNDRIIDVKIRRGDDGKKVEKALIQFIASLSAKYLNNDLVLPDRQLTSLVSAAHDFARNQGLVELSNYLYSAPEVLVAQGAEQFVLSALDAQAMEKEQGLTGQLPPSHDKNLLVENLTRGEASGAQNPDADIHKAQARLAEALLDRAMSPIPPLHQLSANPAELHQHLENFHIHEMVGSRANRAESLAKFRGQLRTVAKLRERTTLNSAKRKQYRAVVNRIDRIEARIKSNEKNDAPTSVRDLAQAGEGDDYNILLADRNSKKKGTALFDEARQFDSPTFNSNPLSDRGMGAYGRAPTLRDASQYGGATNPVLAYATFHPLPDMDRTYESASSPFGNVSEASSRYPRNAKSTFEGPMPPW